MVADVLSKSNAQERSDMQSRKMCSGNDQRPHIRVQILSFGDQSAASALGKEAEDFEGNSFKSALLQSEQAETSY